MELTYKIEQFEGPLDLLLTLVQKNKMNIEDIQISVICDQYMAYIESMQEMNIDVSAEFIVMASELMYIKSKILLPRVRKTREKLLPLPFWNIKEPSRHPKSCRVCIPYIWDVWKRTLMKFLPTAHTLPTTISVFFLLRL